MPAYIPPHRRPHSSSNVLPQNQQAPSAMTESPTGPCQGERPSSSSHWDVTSSHGVLLQAHGDSFIGPLTQLSDKTVDVRRYSGATAKGLRNFQSCKQVGQKLLAYLDETRPDKVLLQFGNVDINISSVYKLETAGEAGWDERQFVADTWDSYQAFLENHLLPRLTAPPNSSSSPSSPSSSSPTATSDKKPGYIQDLYLCQITLPVVSDEALPESYAKYQYPKAKKRNPDLSPEEVQELALLSERRSQRVRLLMPACGLDARRRMTADFNARLKAFVADFGGGGDGDGDGDGGAPGVAGSGARLHLVDLNQYIRKEPGCDEVAAQYVTKDPTNLHVTWENTLLFWVQELASAGLDASHMPTTRELEEQWTRYTARKGEQMETLKQRRKEAADRSDTHE